MRARILTQARQAALHGEHAVKGTVYVVLFLIGMLLLSMLGNYVMALISKGGGPP